MQVKWISLLNNCSQKYTPYAIARIKILCCPVYLVLVGSSSFLNLRLYHGRGFLLWSGR